MCRSSCFTHTDHHRTLVFKTVLLVQPKLTEVFSYSQHLLIQMQDVKACYNFCEKYSFWRMLGFGFFPGMLLDLLKLLDEVQSVIHSIIHCWCCCFVHSLLFLVKIYYPHSLKALKYLSSIYFNCTAVCYQ